MSKPDVYFKPGVTVNTPFGNTIKALNEKIVDMTITKLTKHKFERSQAFANVYLRAEEYLHKLNPELKYQYSLFNKTQKTAVFSKKLIDPNYDEDQVNGIWFYIQSRFLKIQISTNYSLELTDFFNARKEDFKANFDMSPMEFERMQNTQTDHHGESENTIFKYRTLTVTDWFNFQMIDTKPLPLVFDFIKTLDLV